MLQKRIIGRHNLDIDISLKAYDLISYLKIHKAGHTSYIKIVPWSLTWKTNNQNKEGEKVSQVCRELQIIGLERTGAIIGFNQ